MGHDTVYNSKGRKPAWLEVTVGPLWAGPTQSAGTRNLAPCRDSIEEGGGLGFIWPRGATQRALGYRWYETWRYGLTV